MPYDTVDYVVFLRKKMIEDRDYDASFRWNRNVNNFRN